VWSLYKKFWEFRNVSEDEAELLLYGDIASELPWADAGDTVTPQKFYEELKGLRNKAITVRINSAGGDVFAAHAIYTQLKSHKAGVTVVVDGLAASAASIVAMAGDTVKMPANAMMMIHNPALFAFGFLTSDEMRKYAEQLDAVKGSIINAYMAKTELDKETLSRMMDEETWMTGEEAVEMGFADELMFENVPVESKGSVLIVNSINHDMSRFKTLPRVPEVINGVVPRDVSREKAPEGEPWEAPALSDFTDRQWNELSDAEKRRIAGHFAWAASMPPERYSDLKLPHHRPSDGAVVWRGVANAAARLPQSDIPSADISKVQEHLGSHYKQFDQVPPWEENSNKDMLPKKEDESMNIQTVDDLRAAFPDLANQLFEAGIMQERERMRAIDEIAKTIDDSLVISAKYEKAMTAEQLAFEAVKLEQQIGREYMKDLTDSLAQVKNITPQPQEHHEGDKNEKEAVAKAIAEFANKRRAR